MATTEPGPAPAKPACAVTFGRSTLLGRHLAAALAASGRWSIVAVLDPSPSQPTAQSDSPLLRHLAADLSDAAALESALASATAVFHVDATTAVSVSDGSFLSLHRLTVEGTRRLLAACRAAGVGRLVYTGSAEVVAAGARDMINVDEDAAPYPDKFGNAVSELRAQVEMMVLSTDGMDGIRTCVLRPSNLFGPGDSSLVRFVARYARSPLGKVSHAKIYLFLFSLSSQFRIWHIQFVQEIYSLRSGMFDDIPERREYMLKQLANCVDLRFVIGSGSNMSDFTYVDNVAHANICAEQALCSNEASIAGKPFFVTNGEPMETWEFMSCIMEAMGSQRPRIYLPAKMLQLVALFSNMMHHRIGSQMLSTPLLHPETIFFLSCSRTFNTSKARRLLGYQPIVSLVDGIMRTVGSFLEFPDNSGLSRQRGSCGSSKAEMLLGGGTAADILLWRDDKRTFSYITVLFLLFYWFLLSDRTFIASAAKILLVTSLALFIHGVLPPQVFGFTVEKVTSDYFEVSHSALRTLFMCLASAWNGGIHKLRILAEGDDWSILLKVLVFLYSIKLMLNFQFRVLIGFVLASLFIVFIVYEQCEEEIDSIVAIASVKIKWLMDRLVRNLPTSLKAYIS